ncbi:hypothetical protein Q9R46_16080 [Paenibacillus sp. RRE4]|uniref:Prophage tail endopeptidase domain-containing protein n=1 Tax=Paenibacillus silvae TaxID=1325358 RepID=A0ABQ1Z1K1_9BACL|nr:MULTISPECIES: hypothetical protein [Paenibacillus]MDT0124178.1 hypothetical protein [Paenibacillus sp. RRE4]GGH46303.1 hypothetical protein GCM10008014_08880 [Paenibacillus silvae]
MSNCSILMNKQKVYIAADSRECTFFNGKAYWMNDNATKIHRVSNNLVVFTSGNSDICDRVISEFISGNDFSVERLQKILRTIGEEVEAHYPSTLLDKEVGYIDITAIARIQDVKGKRLALYNLNSTENFNIYEYPIKNEDGYIYATVGVKGEEATKIEKQIRGKMDHVKTFKTIYNNISDESVGGKFKMFGIDKNKGVFLEESYEIVDKNPLLKYEDYKHTMGHYILGNKLVISDDEGTFTIEGNLLTVRDKSNNIRVQIGEYKSGVYGFKVIGPLGTVTVDENGIVQTDTIQIADNVDSTHPLKLKFYISPSTLRFDQFQLNFTLERFRAYSKGAASARINLTTTESERILLTTTEIKSFIATSTKPKNVSGSTQTEGTYILEGGHNHGWPEGTQFKDVNGFTRTWVASGRHSHALSLQPHDHEFTVPEHAHDITMPPHSHRIDMPSHSHDIEYGIYEGASATGVRVIINGITRGGIYSSAENNVDITSWIQSPGWHTIELSSQQLGRINASLYMKTFVGA